jgi:hypothetical protein
MTEQLSMLNPPDLRTEPATLDQDQLLKAVIDRGDPNIAAKWMELHERHLQNVAAESFANALARFQGRCPQIAKNRKIDLGGGAGPSYASLDDIMRAIGPLLAECGLCVTFSASVTDAGAMHVICNIRHGRHVESSELTLPVPAQMRVNDTQRMAAALSYAKRHCLCAALNIVVTDEDNDANGMAEKITEQQAATIREWLVATTTDEKRFLNWLHVAAVADIPAARFDECVAMLKRKGQIR